jgi:hypothetical protein
LPAPDVAAAVNAHEVFSEDTAPPTDNIEHEPDVVADALVPAAHALEDVSANEAAVEGLTAEADVPEELSANEVAVDQPDLSASAIDDAPVLDDAQLVSGQGLL